MKKNYLLLSVLSVFAITFLFSISGCVNYDQKTTLYKEGSGYMEIHYWTKTSNIMDEKVGNYYFTEKKAKKNFTCSNSSVKDINVHEQSEDSTTHVNLIVNFNDLNKLSDAGGFDNITPSWQETSNGMEFKYVIAQDTTAANQMDANQYTVTYTFEMPGDIVSTNATKKDGKILTWEFILSDFGTDQEMIAVVRK